MNIFEVLRHSHDIQRMLVEQVLATSGDSPERRELFERLKTELWAHAVAEERHFYIPLMKDDAGVDLSRHAIAEHHEIDELIEKVEETDFGSPAWLAHAKSLGDTVHHHLEEEEHKFFQMAGKLLSDEQKTSLAADYLVSYQDARA